MKLVHEAQRMVAKITPGLLRKAIYILLVHKHFAAGRAGKPAEDMQQSGFAGTRRAYDGNQFTFIDAEVRYFLIPRPESAPHQTAW